MNSIIEFPKVTKQMTSEQASKVRQDFNKVIADRFKAATGFSYHVEIVTNPMLSRLPKLVIIICDQNGRYLMHVEDVGSIPSAFQQSPVFREKSQKVETRVREMPSGKVSTELVITM